MTTTIIHTLTNKRFSKISLYGLAISYAALLFLFLYLSHSKGILGIVIVAVLLTLFWIRHLNLPMPKYLFTLIVIPCVEFLLLITLFWGSGTQIENIVFIIFVTDIILHYKLWYSFIMAYGGYLTYIFLWPSDGDFLHYLINIMGYTFFVLPIWSTKLLMNQKEVNLQLNEALRKEAIALEEAAALRERNRIAEEIHDTMGHTLTTAIVALEGAQLLFDIRPEVAHKKVRVAQDQLKRGLGDIRQVVKMLKATEEIIGNLSLEETIQEMISDVQKQTGIACHLHYNVGIELISIQEYVIFSTIRESVTNSLKHGKSKDIHIVVTIENNTILITVKDEGLGCDNVKFGFGLQSLEGKIRAIGGRFSVRSSTMWGFETHAWLPIAKGEH